MALGPHHHKRQRRPRAALVQGCLLPQAEDQDSPQIETPVSEHH